MPDPAPHIEDHLAELVGKAIGGGGAWHIDGNVIRDGDDYRVLRCPWDAMSCFDDAAVVVALFNSAPGMIEVVRCARECVAAHDAVDDYEDERDHAGPPEPIYDRLHNAERALATALANLDATNKETP